MPPAAPSPLMKQYLDLKTRHKDAILFFRVGDFYEMFYDDAEVASKILEIALTSRDKNKEEAVPLCGVPHHSASGYIAKLIRAGRKVAVCEQMEDPRQARGIVRRDVVRIITPGTVIEPDLLQATEHHYIAAIHPIEPTRRGQHPTDVLERTIGLAYLDLSTGDFRTTEFSDGSALSRLKHELVCIAPRELVLPERLQGDPVKIQAGWPLPGAIQYLPDWQFEIGRAHV